MMSTKKLELTRGEEQIMNALWSIGEGVIGDIIALLDEPKPKYTTAATFIKILEDKGFVARKAGTGRSHIYYPLVKKEEYTRSVFSSMLSAHFDGKITQLVSFFSENEKLSATELEEIMKIVQSTKK